VKGQVGYGKDVFQPVSQAQVVFCELSNKTPQAAHFFKRVPERKVEFSFIHFDLRLKLSIVSQKRWLRQALLRPHPSHRGAVVCSLAFQRETSQHNQKRTLALSPEQRVFSVTRRC
jgi:hypothetical protein